MNCKEFREKISAGNDFDKELIEHKEKCSDCQEWIAKELSTAPKGVSEEAWNKAVSKCLPENNKSSDNKNDKNQKDKSNPEESKSFMDYYLSGLKYGIVFGLAIVIGFSFVHNTNEANKNQNSKKSVNSIASESIGIASDSSVISVASDSDIIILPLPGNK